VAQIEPILSPICTKKVAQIEPCYTLLFDLKKQINKHRRTKVKY